MAGVVGLALTFRRHCRLVLYFSTGMLKWFPFSVLGVCFGMTCWVVDRSVHSSPPLVTLTLRYWETCGVA